MTIDDVRALINERRSIRYFSDKPLEKTVIDGLLELAHLAPSVENTQPWHFHVVLNQDLKTKLMEHSCYGNFISGAAAFIVVTCNRRSETRTPAPIWNPKELEYSCIAAMQNLMLGATAMGIGSCWVSLHHGPAHNLLKLKDYVVVVGGLMLGHMKEGEKGVSGTHERRPISEIVTYHE
jgi:nitroreductase